MEGVMGFQPVGMLFIGKTAQSKRQGLHANSRKKAAKLGKKLARKNNRMRKT